jgi:Flp pilus assembly protein TadD
LVVVLVALGLSLRRVAPGHAVWAPERGTLLRAGSGSQYVVRWKWRPAGEGRLACTLAAASREGARVDVSLDVAFPAGRFTLAAAATAEDGLKQTVEPVLRERLAALPMACFAGVPQTDCPAGLEVGLADRVAETLGVRRDALSLRVVPDPAALAAARGAALRERVGRPPRRVLLVGWDGADWELLEPFARRGVMPNLDRLMRTGSWGELASITPLLSPLIWTTMATGVGPEEHGILDFVEVDPATGAKVPVTGRQRRVPALWNMASAAGISVVVTAWWATWPAEPVNGVLVSDRLFALLPEAVAGAPAGTVVFPPAREREFQDLVKRADLETDERAVRALLPVSSEAYRAARAAHRGMADPIDGFRRILVGTRTYFGAAMLAAANRPDLELVYCIGTDELGHLLAPHLPPPLPGADAGFSEAARMATERYFSIVDRWLGRLLEMCPVSECAVLVVSDHGFKWGWRETGAATTRRDDRPREFSGVAAATAAMWHRPLGVFVLAGHGVSGRGRVAKAPSVYDVAPTVAALLGLPAGTGWRGKPLPGSPAPTLPPVDWVALVPPESYRPAGGAARPSEEYIAQLKALGYLEGSEGGGQGQGATEGELNNLGLVHLEAKRYPEAERAFRDSIARNPRYASPHYNLRRLYFETDRFEEADKELWEAVALGLRDSSGAVSRAATDYETSGMPERAVTLLGEAVRRFQDNAPLAVRQIALLVQTGRCVEAQTSGREAAGRFSGHAAVHAFYGLAAACAGDFRVAREAFERSLALNPNQPAIRQALDALPGS